MSAAPRDLLIHRYWDKKMGWREDACAPKRPTCLKAHKLLPVLNSDLYHINGVSSGERTFYNDVLSYRSRRKGQELFEKEMSKAVKMSQAVTFLLATPGELRTEPSSPLAPLGSLSPLQSPTYQ
ncbi:hypothetical protein MG293_011532 [Ovis ammon polii]|uniref:Uncharacterized protein n=1 Tax=Ovis ammon polii TaxID=230172 RepID=A0AAD4U5E0_OVIAM|nr:hypothetical protein MG293_011532 [Ovis ammon polii]